MFRIGEHNNDGFAYVLEPDINQGWLQERPTGKLWPLIHSLPERRVPSRADSDSGVTQVKRQGGHRETKGVPGGISV